jgi:hypothetical protein
MDNSRRRFMKIKLAAAMTIAADRSVATASTNEAMQPSPENLSATLQIETTHPRIVSLSQRITSAASSDTAAAVLLHDWVRDEIPFGIPRTFYDATATEVLDEKVGYFNTKATLFSALLRARGVPTRIRMMDLSSRVLDGLFDPGTPYVDHAITEVFLDQRWVKVDSYVVDSQLASAAAKRLKESSTKAGFGVHVDGDVKWDGKQDNFIQCKDNGSISNYVLKDHGLFSDVADFYRRIPESRNRKTIGSALLFQFGATFLNRRIQSIRAS